MMLDRAMPDYVPPPVVNQVNAVPPASNLHKVSSIGGDVRAQELRDGADVAALLGSDVGDQDLGMSGTIGGTVAGPGTY